MESEGEIRIQQKRPLPNFLLRLKLKYMKLGYFSLVSNLLPLCLVPLFRITLLHASRTSMEDLYHLLLYCGCSMVAIIVSSALLVLGLIAFIMSSATPVYLVDYACYRAPDYLRAPLAVFMKHSRLTGGFNESSLEFQCKILKHSGLGEDTYVPEAMHCIPPSPSMAKAKEEAEQVMFGVLDNLFSNTKSIPRTLVFLS